MPLFSVILLLHSSGKAGPQLNTPGEEANWGGEEERGGVNERREREEKKMYNT